MAKVSGPLYSTTATGKFARVLDFTKDGNVRQERHIAPPKSSGVATSRAIVKAINGVSKVISNTRRQELQDAFTDPQNWASTIATHTIGEQRSSWLNDAALWSLLDSTAQNDWADRADEMHIRDISVVDVDHTAHTVGNGEALFHVARGVHRCGLSGAPDQPTGNNAQDWKDYLSDSQPAFPVNVIVLNNEPLLLDAQLLTLG